MDSNETNWTFEAVSGMVNTFKIKTGDNYAHVETGLYNVMIGEDTNNNKSYWKLVTAANKSDNSVASVSNPIDRSYLITNARFEINTTGWTGDCTRGGNGKDDNNTTAEGNWNTHNACVERYHATTDVYQTLSGLANGKYIVKCQGFYRADANSSHASFLYANDEESALNLISGENIPNSMSDASTRFSNDEYWNTITVNVTNGTLKIGVKTEDTNNWTIFDNFQLYYVDPYVSILASEAFTSGNTMTAGQWYTFTVPTDGDYTLSATDGILCSSEDCLLSAASSATSTVALKAGTAYFKSAASQSLTITYVEPVLANGDYYLYDATNKVFLSRGANYGTRATVDKYGIPFTWNNYSKTITFKDWSNTFMFFDQNEHSACWLYTDGDAGRGDNRLFAFEATTGGYYLRDLAKAVYVRDDGSVLSVPTTNSAEATVWSIKTKAEHDAIVAAYATENIENVITSASISTTAAEFETYLSENLAAKDKTSSVKTAKFTGSAGDWTFTQVENRSGATNYGKDYAEMFQRTGNWSQEITGLSQGIYKVTVNAFERITGYAVCNTLGAEGFEPVTAYFKANNEQAQLASWYSDKEGTNNPNNTDEAATAFNNDKYKIEFYTYVGSDGKLTLTLNKPSYNTGTWVLFNNVTLTYYDSNVSDEEATAILAEAATAMSSPMKASLYQALATAKNTFEGSKTVPNYNALRTAINNTATSITSYAAMKANYLDPITEYLETTNFVDQTSAAYTAYVGYKAAYDNYTNAETADVENATANALNWNSGDKYVTLINNIMMANWKIGNTNALTNNSGFYMNTWSTESDGTAPAADFANPFYEYWVSSGSLAATTLTGTLTGLTANTAYDVTAKVRVQGSSKVAGSITMEVVGGIPVEVTAGDQIGETARYIKSYTATGVTDGDGNLVLKFNVAANSNISWLSFRDVTYAANGTVTPSNDFTALNTAIASYGNNIGFETGEYAPYTNIAGIEALAIAKAFDQNRYYTPAAITAATTALTGATWTANTTKLNAFYDGDFSIQAPKNDGSNGTAVTGWTANNNIRTLVKSETEGQALYKATEGHSGMYVWGTSGATYGETAGYTIPLKANTVYRFAYKRASWNGDDSNTEGKFVVKNPEGTVICEVEETGGAPVYTSTTRDFISQTGYFATGEKGDYVVILYNYGNTVFTDLQLYSVDDNTLEFADGSVPNYAPGTYPSVKITRTLTANRWATAVYPFAVSGVDNIAVLDSYDASTGKLGFTSAAASTANVPFMMMSTTDKSEITLSNVEVAATAANPVATKSEASLIGSYTSTEITNNENNYFLSSNVIYKVGTDGADISPYRAYIQLTGSGAEARSLTFVIDGEATAISGIAADKQLGNGNVYNLKGQKVSGQLKKGVYVVNGKKVAIK